MRPIKLVMQAFGSYGEHTPHTEVDFDSLGSHGLYLISGNTGSGKTTIFDAIKFALYGEASGTNREVKDLRTVDLDPAIKTYVELTFEYNGRRYFIHREPVINKKKNQDADKPIILKELSSEHPEKEMENPDERIVEILGLQKDEFSQIVMIAQGEFYDLLFASTQNRLSIMRNLFHTENYEKVQQQLSDRYTYLDKQNSSYLNLIAADIRKMDLDPEDEDHERFLQIKDQKIIAKEDLQILQDMNKRDRQRLSQLNEDIRNNDQQLRQKEKLVAKAEQQLNARKTLKENQEKLQIEQEKTPQIEKTRAQAEQDKTVLDRLNQQIAVDQLQLKKYDELDRAKKDLESFSRQLETLDMKKQEWEKQITLSRSQLEQLAQEYAALADIENSLAEKKQQRDDCDLKLNSCAQLLDQLKALDEEKIRQQQLQEQNAVSSKAYEQIRQEYEHARSLYQDELPGILAKQLVAGKACPVCGSTDHPSPAQVLKKVPSRDELADQEKQLKQVQDAYNALHNELTVLNNTISQQEEFINTQAMKIFPAVEGQETRSFLQERQKQLTAMLSRTQKEYAEISAQAQRKKQIETQRQQTSDALNELKEKKNSTENELVTVRTNIANTERNIADLNKDLPFPEKKKAEIHLREEQNKASALEEFIRKANEDFTRHEKIISSYETAIATAKEVLKEVIDIDLDKEKQLIAELQQQKKEAEQNKESITKRNSINETCLQAIGDNFVLKKQIEEELTWFKPLYDTANGRLSISQSTKLTFETFVQIFYFDKVLYRANRRLRSMTNDTYQILRRTQSHGNAKIGLDLDVVYRNGPRRSITTLSGGECFQAALAFALGLSDEIQSRTGGIQLNTLFIDEGFGSLDDEALDNAISTLKSLSDTSRMIGIISHVQALKDKIDNKIIVTKDEEGHSSIDYE